MDWKAYSHFRFQLLKSCEKEPNFLCISDPHQLVTSFIGAFENLALQSKAITKNLFFDIETTINIKLGSLLEKLTQSHNRREQAYLDDCDNESFTSTQFLQIQKKQLIDLQEHLERYCKCFTYLWFQQRKILSQPNKILFVTHSCYRT